MQIVCSVRAFIYLCLTITKNGLKENEKKKKHVFTLPSFSEDQKVLFLRHV